MINEKFKHFVTILRRNCITNKCSKNFARSLWSKFSYRLWTISICFG